MYRELFAEIAAFDYVNVVTLSRATLRYFLKVTSCPARRSVPIGYRRIGNFWELEK